MPTPPGFTLLEMVIAIGIFSVVVIVTVGVILAISAARIQAAALQNVQDNTRFAVDLMARDLRNGFGYVASSCGAAGCSQINFTWVDPLSDVTEPRGYCWDVIGGRGVIRRLYSGITSCSNGAIMTADEVAVDRLSFWVDGNTTAWEDGQPRLTISLRVRSQNPRLISQPVMEAQTTVVQRIRGL